MVRSIPLMEWWRWVPSYWVPIMRVAPTSHRLECPRAHDGHFPHAGMNPNTTWSPGARSVTPGPTSSTTPAPSWPPMIG